MTENRANEEYEAKHFEFSANDFVNSAEELIKEQVFKTFMEFKEQYELKYETNLTEQIHKVHEDCMPNIKKCVDCISALALSHFTIPCNVLLPCDEIQLKQYTEDEEKQIDQEIENLELQLKNQSYVEARLREELSKQSVLCTIAIQHIEEDLMNLDSFLKGNTMEKCEAALKEVEAIYGKSVDDGIL